MSAAISISTPPPPLVARMGSRYLWVQRGMGWTLDMLGDRVWRPLTTQPVGGYVVQGDALVSLVALFGRPQ